MRKHDESFRLAATDLSNHLNCHHLTELNLAVARGERERPKRYDPRTDVLRERGFEHEQRYLEQLRAEGREVAEVESFSDSSVIEQTIALMRSGADAIAQGALAHDNWFGRPDVLLRVDRPSELGSWSYEAVDTKLARETRGATILQLCLYSELVASVQSVSPERMHVVAPAEVLAPEPYRVADYLAYYRFIQRRLLEAVAPDGERGSTYPEPVEHCQVCAYWSECDRRRRGDDHLSLVAGASRGQRRELEGRGISTLARLAEEPIPLSWKPTRGSAATLERTREQARVQLEGRIRKTTYHELLELEPERGLARLPEPHAADVFFDFEGDAFVGTAGLEYVFGWVTHDERGEPSFDFLWADDAQSEKRAFERFVDAMIERLESHRGFHIYHFTAYEPATLKRLMGRYATREVEVDRLLRAKVFVDLHSVVRQSLRAAVERYSLKDLEDYCGFERELELDEARRVRYRVERLLELGQAEAISDSERERLLQYNREDCESTLRLRDWLESLRAGRVAAGETIERPPLAEDKASDPVEEQDASVAAVMERLLEGVPVDEAERTPGEHGRWLLAHLVDYHRREKKVSWWDYFRLRDLDADELFDESVGLGGLELVGEVDSAGRTPVHRYRFPRQEAKLKVRQDAHFGYSQIGTVAGLERTAGTIDIKKRKDTAEVHPPAIFVHSNIPLGQKPKAMLRFAESVADVGWGLQGSGRAARDLVLRLPPRLPVSSGGDSALEARPDESPLAAAKRLVASLDRGVLPIQGPPGSGKTYTGARMAVELVRLGKRVGVSATSHRVIRNFLTATLEAAAEDRVAVGCGHRDKPRDDDDPRLAVVYDYDKIRGLLEGGDIQVLAGTPWLWARGDFADSVDVLFIDEAGQMALADVLACAGGAESLVLLGDPQQLEQPQQGSHPDGTHVSALGHLLGDAQTLSEGAGLFLERTYRLHPELCTFTSELFYEGRLQPEDGNERQLLEGPILDGAGLWFLPVEHEGNQSSSPEEVDAIGELVESLVAGTTRWTDKEGAISTLALDQILIVAPYNAHVQALAERLPGARVGTVDKFQGQEAPVVIFSTATSTPDLAPRGMEFLYDASRLNVATSRAKSACALVGSPRLFEPECKTPRQIKLANAFCRYLEVATPLRRDRVSSP